ncbi:MAG: septum site-determining protein MinC [Synechococcales cyanobacterium M58_A2018_015]|nr:septum site-determining protein MinC [Synechococcales cyanobacterium M58_A2018_015]
MTSDSSLPAAIPSIVQPAPEVNPVPQVRFKGESGRLLLLLPSETEVVSSAATWTDIWQQLKQRLNAGERFWQPNTPVHLIARDRLLDGRQLQSIADALTEAQLQLKRVYTSRRQTAVAAATTGLSVEQQSPVAHLNQPEESGQALAEPLYIQTTVRSGMEVRHPGTVIILGDVNPGSTIIADGDVLVWGMLRGVVQAGAAGNTRCVIMALRMEPTQLRIADFVARAPEAPPNLYQPEVAYVISDSIRIIRAADFSKERLLPPVSSDIEAEE